jgi:uroporphyrin-III C-methyltransferase
MTFSGTPTRPPVIGKVLLVGAGPGPADLLTLGALRALQTADIVVHDALVGTEILELIPRTTRRIAVGKRGHRVSTSQDFINRLLVRCAREGALTVRLKGGDPSTFGRSAEETAFLASHGVQVEVIAGVTTASAAAAQFGFSLTKRDVAQKVVFATGRTIMGTQNDWADAAHANTTLCLYMGCGDIEQITEELVSLGRDPATPALLALSVGRKDSRLIKTSLSQLPKAVELYRNGAPGLIVIGEVCRDAHDAHGTSDWADFTMLQSNPDELEQGRG